MYVSIEGQGHFFTIYFPGFVCFVLYWAKISGERLQDHWSSGSFHRLIMEKVEICNFFLSQWRYLEFFFTEMFIEKSSTFRIFFVQIGVFDWLSGRQKGSVFVKMFKNLLLRNHKEDEPETWHTC